jgi:hypothetical protein
VEAFQGKIVYNPDGSAYIIDPECESIPSSVAQNDLAGSTINPRIHSFRVVSSKDVVMSSPKNRIQSESNSAANNDHSPGGLMLKKDEGLVKPTDHHQQQQQKIQKPVLMCFICKLSFGNAKLFQLHANNEHNLNLNESEKLLLSREYSSAIIQRNNDEKPQISFLEPLDCEVSSILPLKVESKASPKTANQHHQQQFLSEHGESLDKYNSNSNGSLNNNKSGNINVSPHHQQQQQLHKSLSGSVLKETVGSKLFSDFLLQSQQQQQQLRCPEHAGLDAAMNAQVDCKNCEMINISTNLAMPSSPKNLTKSPSSLSQVASSPVPLNISSTGLNVSPTAPSFTIGACPDHINGRPIGVDCAR